MHLSSDSYVDVDACRMWYYEMWFYDGTCDGGQTLVSNSKIMYKIIIIILSFLLYSFR